ncbi:MAG: hypothetical protein GX949_01340, partial [Peptococcaceae bacterium]|nr:hypothetical protein [Peptococcaceae bacterium]
SIICHGRSNAKAVQNGVRVAIEAVENSLVSAIFDSIHKNDYMEEVDVNLAQRSV